MNHPVIWTQPPALLANGAPLIPAPRAVFQAPAILRFSSDGFMQEVLDLLQTAPERLGDYRVRPETWRGFTAQPAPQTPRAPSRMLQRLGVAPRPIALPAAESRTAAPPAMPLKLYQPAQQRHYLVACSLVCQVAGLPDRRVEPGQGERAACVIRRLLPPSGVDNASIEAWEEHAWVPGPHGHVWQRMGVNPSEVLAGEERLALFPLHFAENGRRQRRLFAGVIPVGRREAYLGAPKSSGGGSAPGVTSRTSRKILLRKEVIEPWKSLVRRAQDVRASFVGPFTGDDRPPTATEKAARLRLEREQIQTVSWFVLLDFAKYLAAYVKPVWRAVIDPSRADALTDPERQLFDALGAVTLSTTLRERLCHDTELSGAGNEIYPLANVVPSLRGALARFGSGTEAIDVALERRLEGIDEQYERLNAARRALWPGFLFPLADPDLPSGAAQPPFTTLGGLSQEESGELALDENPAVNDPLERLDRLAVLVVRALRDDVAEPAPEPAIPIAAIPPANAFEGWFVIRCVFERPGCEPLHGDVVSAPTERFQMAGFFDPDAPARPIRIGLPIDTTPGGLRKFDKNTAFMISDTLCGQIRRVRGLSLADLVLSVLPWPLHKDLPVGAGGPCRTDAGLSLGMICSMSIPIITLCALVLLMVMVSLLDFVFRWMPYFVICFPVPGFKAKQGSSG
jgi:hypothetical protein